jgi:hypothetical protein
MMGPNQSHRPELTSATYERLNTAIALGLRLLKVPRYHELVLPPEFFVDESQEIADRTNSVLAAIQSRGVGKARLLEFGLQLAMDHMFTGSFFEIPPVDLQPEESKKVGRLVAEWADGDAIAAHFGYRNDLFCSEDFRKTATGPSVFQPANREWLTMTFGIEFVTLGELAEMVPA